ncbi:MAG TPA: tRNA uridine(34) 5-carboxymethylaminomethyl modification radical SAM/GNAT enzyme Elp3, partial [Nitrososphaeraceae archaeon]|nr:tRNA uridine(34) 5-carboxymethylaminomethyl modification radical SAM/GNAT enzyme Elp3 [Nitrososphaeraceae archaeon]
MNSPTYEELCREIATELDSIQNPHRREVMAVIKKSCSKHRARFIPANQSILKYVSSHSMIRRLLKVKPVKTASGVAVIAL